MTRKRTPAQVQRNSRVTDNARKDEGPRGTRVENSIGRFPSSASHKSMCQDLAWHMDFSIHHEHEKALAILEILSF